MVLKLSAIVLQVQKVITFQKIENVGQIMDEYRSIQIQSKTTSKPLQQPGRDVKFIPCFYLQFLGNMNKSSSKPAVVTMTVQLHLFPLCTELVVIHLSNILLKCSVPNVPFTTNSFQRSQISISVYVSLLVLFKS